MRVRKIEHSKILGQAKDKYLAKKKATRKRQAGRKHDMHNNPEVKSIKGVRKE